MGQNLMSVGHQRPQSQDRTKGELLYELVISNGNADAIRALFSQGASLEWTDQNGRNPLIVACMNPNLFDAAKTLIELGANVNAYRRGRHAGTILHHAAKEGLEPIVTLLLSHGANAFVRNDDCQTPLDVARLNGHTKIVRAIEHHLCYFSGWLREINGPGILERLARRLVTRKIWVVVIPHGPTNSTKPLQFELAIYSTVQDAQPFTVISLWKAQIERPDLRQSDPKITIFDDSTKSCFKLASGIQGDAQQFQSFYNACQGISQVMSSPIQHNSQPSIEAAELAVAPSDFIQSAPPYTSLAPSLDQIPEASNFNGWDIRDNDSFDWSGLASETTHSDPNSTGWINKPVKDNYNGWSVEDCQPVNLNKQAQTNSENTPTSTMNDNIFAPFSSAPSAPAIPVELLAEGPIYYPSIDPITDVSTQAVAKEASTSSDTNAGGSCVICWEAPIEGALIPCGHMAGCMSCLNEINAKKGVCPVCRSKINQVVRLYAVSISLIS